MYIYNKLKKILLAFWLALFVFSLCLILDFLNLKLTVHQRILLGIIIPILLITIKNMTMKREFLLIIFALIGCTRLYSAEATATKASTVTAEVIFGKTIDGISLVGPYVGLTVQALSIGMEIQKHSFPTEEERAHAKAVAERYSFLVAEKEFTSCMMYHRNCACEAIARLLIVLEGKEIVDKMTITYNQFRK